MPTDKSAFPIYICQFQAFGNKNYLKLTTLDSCLFNCECLNCELFKKNIQTEF